MNFLTAIKLASQAVDGHYITAFVIGYHIHVLNIHRISCTCLQTTSQAHPYSAPQISRFEARNYYFHPYPIMQVHSATSRPLNTRRWLGWNQMVNDGRANLSQRSTIYSHQRYTTQIVSTCSHIPTAITVMMKKIAVSSAVQVFSKASHDFGNFYCDSMLIICRYNHHACSKKSKGKSRKQGRAFAEVRTSLRGEQWLVLPRGAAKTGGSGEFMTVFNRGSARQCCICNDFKVVVFYLPELPTISPPHTLPLVRKEYLFHTHPHLTLPTVNSTLDWWHPWMWHVTLQEAQRLVWRYMYKHEIKTTNNSPTYRLLYHIQHSNTQHWQRREGRQFSHGQGLWDTALRITHTFKLRVQQLIQRGAHYVAVGAARRIQRHLVEDLHVVQLRSFGYSLLLSQIHPVCLVQDLMHTHAQPTMLDSLTE